MKFISFGSGSSGNCYYLFTDNEGLIIDAGLGLRMLKKYCREYGVSLAAARHILITHDHADHVKSVGSLSYELNLPVYSTAEVHEGIVNNFCVNKKSIATWYAISRKAPPSSWVILPLPRLLYLTTAATVWATSLRLMAVTFVLLPM